MPSHTHGSNNRDFITYGGGGTFNGATSGGSDWALKTETASTGGGGSHTHNYSTTSTTTTNTGTNSSFNVVNPYYAIYIWTRTA